MSGLELTVLVPMVYGIIHLGKKVLDQRSVINSQMETITRQQEHLAALQLQSTAAAVPPSAAATISKVAVVGGVAVTGAITAYKLQQLLRSSRRHEQHAPGASYKPPKATGDADACVICVENQRDTLTQPCRHLVLCWPCSERLVAVGGDAKCPVCRGPIQSRLFTYN